MAVDRKRADDIWDGYESRVTSSLVIESAKAYKANHSQRCYIEAAIDWLNLGRE